MAYSSDPSPLAAPGLTERRSLATGNALGVASMIAWAAGFPAAELLLAAWPPIVLITARLIVAVGILVPIWILLDGFGAVRAARWGRGVIVGGMGFGLGTFLLLVAQSLTDPVTVALIASASPLAATLMEMAQGSRRLTGNFALGLLASVFGGIIATDALAPAALGLGAVCAIASVFLFAWGSMRAVQDFPDLSPVGRSTITLAGGMVAMTAATGAALAAGADILPHAAVTADQVGLLLIYALAGMALSQVMWIASVGRLGVAVASFHINVAPFYVMVIMASVGGGWSWAQAGGAAVVGLGVVLSQAGTLRKSPRNA